MRRRDLIPFSLAAALLAERALFAETSSSIRGQLAAGDKPVLILEGRRITLSGDEDTMKVLADERLDKADLEVAGRYENEGRFAAAPIGLHALAVYKGGKRLYVTYWCDNCSVRYVVPGPCVCCGKFTALDLRDQAD